MARERRRLTGIRIAQDPQEIQECGPQGHLNQAAEIIEAALKERPIPPRRTCPVCGIIPNMTLESQAQGPKVIERTQDGREHHTAVARMAQQDPAPPNSKTQAPERNP